MKKPVMVECDGCRLLTPVQPRERKRSGLHYIYFQCRHCGRTYVVSCTDAALRGRIREYGKLQKKINGERDCGRRKALLEQAARMLGENAAESERLLAQHPLGEEL